MACQGSARAQDDGDSRPSPSRGLLKRGLLAKGKPTTTTTPAPQVGIITFSFGKHLSIISPIVSDKIRPKEAERFNRNSHLTNEAYVQIIESRVLKQ